MLLLGLPGLALMLAGAASFKDVDTDKDGLSDFHETHKYFTDPGKADSDGDGLKDGDWNERREFAYSVRAVMHIMPPFDLESMNDDYQDLKVLERKSDHLKIEVILYPFNAVAAALDSNPGWRAETSSMQEFLRPGLTTNWDDKMREDLLAALDQDGIDLEKCDDREAAQKVAAWLMQHSKYEDSFTTFAVENKGGKLRVVPELRGSVEEELKKRGRKLDEQWDCEVMGKGMFYTRIHGSCTSSANFLATGLRAAGIPTRQIVCFPVLDASDPEEASLPDKLEHHQVRETLRKYVAQAGSSWSSHTFNEVFVGGRWRRLNYERLGQNILDQGCLGLMVHVHTFLDLADAGMTPWGIRDGRSSKSDVFGHSNPYSCLELNDQFGAHAKVENPEVAAGEDPFQELTISRIEWFFTAQKSGRVNMSLDDAATAGHLVVHVEEGIAGEGAGQYQRFYDSVSKKFVLAAKGHPEVHAVATRGYWADPSIDLKEFYLQIPPADFERMKKNIAYSLSWVKDDGKHRWKVRDEVTITRFTSLGPKE